MLDRRFSNEHRRLFNFLLGYRVIAFFVALILLPTATVSERITILAILTVLVVYNSLVIFFRKQIFAFLITTPAIFVIDVLLAGLALFFGYLPGVPFNFYSVAPVVMGAMLYKARGYTLAALTLTIFQLLAWVVFGQSLPSFEASIAEVIGQIVAYFVVGFMATYVVNLIEEIIKQRKIIKTQAEQQAIIEERQRLSRELHDNLAQIFAGIKLRSEVLRNSAGNSPLADDALAIASATKDGLQALREAIFSLREDAFNTSLSEVFSRYCRELTSNIGFQVQASFGKEPPLSQETKAELFRICQEALHNANKHSGQQEALLAMSITDGYFLLKVQDKGNGFDTVANQQRGFGLKNMQERAKKLGANLQIDSNLGSGTTVTISLSIEKETHKENSSENEGDLSLEKIAT